MKILIQATLLLTACHISFFSMGAEEEPASKETESTESILSEEAEENIVDEETTEDVVSEEVADTKKVTVIPRFLPNTTDKRSISLLNHMSLMDRDDEVVTLSNLEETFYGLYLPSASSQPQGGVLILHDEEQHGHWPDIIGSLREYLPLFGWSTLTIELPDRLKRQRIPREIAVQTALTDNESEEPKNSNDQPNNETSEAVNLTTEAQESEGEEAKDSVGPESIASDETDEDMNEVNNENEPALPRLDKLPDLPIVKAESQAPEEDNIDRIADYQAQNRQRVNTAIEYLQQQNQYNLVIIGLGQGASWAVDFVHQKIQLEAEPKGLTLVTIDAQPNAYDKNLINQQLEDISLPYLDLLQSKKQLKNRSAAKRLSIMRRNNNSKYQQIITPEISSYNELENSTNRRIRGWIKTNAGGTQIAVKP